MRVPARVHWLSVAPLLEPLDLRPWLGCGIDWIVVGGETGAKDARYMEPDWARDLRDQCSDTGAALFLKQMWKRQAIPFRPVGARVSCALIGSWAATIGMLHPRRLGNSLRLRELVTTSPLPVRRRTGLQAEPRPSPVSLPVP